jgi:hypothetical protein
VKVSIDRADGFAPFDVTIRIETLSDLYGLYLLVNSAEEPIAEAMVGSDRVPSTAFDRAACTKWLTDFSSSLFPILARRLDDIA